MNHFQPRISADKYVPSFATMLLMNACGSRTKSKLIGLNHKFKTKNKLKRTYTEIIKVN